MHSLFRLKQFSLKQSDRVFRITTDSILLGAYAEFLSPLNLLDVGTGTGIVALMLAQKYKDTRIWGIDINEEAAGLARYNFDNSPWPDRLQAIAGDYRSYDFGHLRFDGIVSNPPFFVASKMSEKGFKQVARHDIMLTYRDLARRTAELLTEKGRAYVIIPYQNLRLLEREFNFEYLFCHKRLYICSKKGGAIKRVIVRFTRRIEHCEEERISIMDGGEYSSEYKELTKDFYINF